MCSLSIKKAILFKSHFCVCLVLYFLWEKDVVELPGGFVQDGLEDETKIKVNGDTGWTKIKTAF